MGEQRVSFLSDGLTLAGVVRVPEGLSGKERRPAFIVLHGFGSTMNAGNVLAPCAMLEQLGYVTLRFDMRGCGDSGGESGHLICLEQVSDTRNALSFLAEHEAVDATRIALIGSSFGAAVAIYTAGIDARVAAIVSAGGWGNGQRKFKGQHKTQEAYGNFIAMLDEGRRHRQRTGRSLMVSRYDIVPIPEQLRGHVVEHSVQMLSVETAQSMFDFCAEEVIGNIAPRPILLLHSAQDSVTPTEQSIELFRRAGKPTDLHLFAGTDHFMFAESNGRVRSVLIEWLANYCPIATPARL